MFEDVQEIFNTLRKNKLRTFDRVFHGLGYFYVLCCLVQGMD